MLDTLYGLISLKICQKLRQVRSALSLLRPKSQYHSAVALKRLVNLMVYVSGVGAPFGGNGHALCFIVISEEYLYVS